MIAWLLSAEDGQKMDSINRRAIVAKTKITDMKVLAQQVVFGRERSYPCTFTLVCGAKGKGTEGSFDVKVYARDKKLTVVKF